MLEHDIEVIKGNEVENILHNNHKVQGVKLDNNKEIKADYVVCNADPPAVYDELLNHEKNNKIFNWKRKAHGIFYGPFCLLLWY